MLTNINSYFCVFVVQFAVFLTPQVTAKEMDFNIVYFNHTNVVVADGDITAETPDKFRIFLATDPFDGYRLELWLNSNGGSLLGGMELGALIRNSYKFQTVVASMDTNTRREKDEAYCYSACALAFMGGLSRDVPTGAQIGFHQFSSKQNTTASYENLAEQLKYSEATTQILSSIVLKYLIEMGGSIELFYNTAATLPEEMFIPEKDDLLELGITTTNHFHDFKFEPYGQGVLAYSNNDQNVEGRNIVQQITTLCSSGKKYLLLSGPENFPGLREDFLKATQEIKPAFRIDVGKQSYLVDYSNLKFFKGVRPVLRISLSSDLANMMTEDEFGGTLEMGGIWGYFFSFRTMLSDEISSKIKASFTHCYK